MNLALSESLGQELRFAQKINLNGVIKLKLCSKEDSNTNLFETQTLKFQKHV